jgi:hypothetical protein
LQIHFAFAVNCESRVAFSYSRKAAGHPIRQTMRGGNLLELADSLSTTTCASFFAWLRFRTVDHTPRFRRHAGTRGISARVSAALCTFYRSPKPCVVSQRRRNPAAQSLEKHVKPADEPSLNAKREKIEALRVGGRTAGERTAAQAALDRLNQKPILSITATLINIDRGNTFYETSFVDVEGRARKIRLSRELFHKPDQVVAELMKAGAALSDDLKVARQQVQTALGTKSPKIHRVTSRPGWHGRDSFVYPTRTFGALQDTLSYEPADDGDEALAQVAGTLNGWGDGLRAPCEASDYLVLVIANKAASALLDIIGQQEGMLLHLHGTNGASRVEDRSRSSSGKSLATRAGASMAGRCRKNDLLTFAITERAVEDHCSGHNSLGIEFDEEGRSFEGKTTARVSASQLSYIVASGRGGVRSTKATRDVNLKNRIWTLNATSSGELPLDDPSVRNARAEGEQVRMIGLPVPSGRKGGIFNRVTERGADKMARCTALARQIESTISANYGVAFPAFVETLVSKRPALERRARQLIDNFVKDVGADGSPWERRFGEKFGLAYAAAVLLAEFGVAPWTPDRAHRAIRNMYKKARRAAATVDEAATKLIRRLQRQVAKKRYPLIKKGAKISAKKRKKAQRGLRWDVVGLGRALLIPMSNVQELVQSPALAAPVLRWMAKRKIVDVGSDCKLTRQILVSALTSEKRRYVCFDVKALSSYNGRSPTRDATLPREA